MRELLVASRVEASIGRIGAESVEVLQRVIEDAARVLEEIGIRCLDPTVRELLEGTGLAAFDETTGRIHVLRDLVRRSLQSTPKNDQFWLPTQSFGFGGTAPFFLDDRTGEHIPATPEKIRRFAATAEEIDLVSFTGRGVLLDKRNREAIQIIARTTAKTVYAGVQGPEDIEAVEELHTSRGRILIILDPVHSPLTMAENMIPRLMEAARRRIPLILASMPMPGVTAPYSMTGMLTLAFAEYLAGLVIVQTAAPGVLTLCGVFPTVTDISRQYALDFGGRSHNVANMLMSHIPMMLDIPACQSGCTTNEKALTPRAIQDAKTGHAIFKRYGCHMIRHAFGFTKDLLAFSVEKARAVAEACRQTTAADAPAIEMPVYDEDAFDALARNASSASFMTDPHTLKNVGAEFVDG
jgi:trimethylamine:corrinoid methyltransferase-like protein